MSRIPTRERAWKVVAKLNDALSGSEALYGFCGWLTTRDEPVTMSSHDDAGCVADLVDTFCKTNDLSDPRDGWDKKLRHPKTASTKTWPGIREEYTQKYGANHHCLRLVCSNCEGTMTCRCSTPKITEQGLCDTCMKLSKDSIEWVKPDFQEEVGEYFENEPTKKWLKSRGVIFKDKDSLIKALDNGKLQDMARNQLEGVANLTLNPEDFKAEMKDMDYASGFWDLEDSLRDKNSVRLQAPILLKIDKDYYGFSGNRRMNLALKYKLPMKFWVVPLETGKTATGGGDNTKMYGIKPGGEWGDQEFPVCEECIKGTHLSYGTSHITGTEGRQGCKNLGIFKGKRVQCACTPDWENLWNAIKSKKLKQASLTHGYNSYGSTWTSLKKVKQLEREDRGNEWFDDSGLDMDKTKAMWVSEDPRDAVLYNLSAEFKDVAESHKGDLPEKRPAGMSMSEEEYQEEKKTFLDAKDNVTEVPLGDAKPVIEYEEIFGKEYLFIRPVRKNKALKVASSFIKKGLYA